MNGESEKVDSEAIKICLERLKTIMASDTFKADETGLLFKCLTIKHLIWWKEKNLLMEKNLKNVFQSFSQLEWPGKIKPLVIGKSANSKCFKRYNIKNLGINYHNNKKAWMTGIIWKKWFIKIENHFQQKSWKILLFVDYFSAHVNLRVL